VQVIDGALRFGGRGEDGAVTLSATASPERGASPALISFQLRQEI